MVVLNDEEIQRYIGNSEPTHPRWKISSREILDSAYLQKVGIVEENEWIRKIRGLCLQVSSPKLEPHNINVIIKKPLPGTIQFARCSCTGGKSGKCKHAVALLKYISMKETLEPWTCTTGSCTWSSKEIKEVEENVLKPIPLQDFCHHIKKEETAIEIPNFFESASYKALAQYIPDKCTFMKFLKGRGTASALQTRINASNIPTKNEFPKKYTNLYTTNYFHLSVEDLVAISKSMKFTLSLQEIRAIEEATRGQARNENWFSYRIGRITASCAGKVVKSKTFTSNMSVLKNICRDVPKKINTPALRYGRDNEKHGLAFYETVFQGHTNFKIQTVGLFISEQNPWIAASPDALAECDCCGKRVVEIKCPYDLSSESGKNLEMTDLKWLPLKETHDYFYQIQTQMFCVNVEICDFVIWSKKGSSILRYFIDKEKCQTIIDKCTNYFYNAIMPEILSKIHSRNKNNS